MQSGKFQRCSIEDLYRVWSARTGNQLPQGSQIIDVREYAEFTQEHIPGVTLAPLSGLEMHARALESASPVYVICHWGNRSLQAAKKLTQWGFRDVRIVDGGMLAWTAAELPVERAGSNVWSLERQVRFSAGALALVGAVLGWLIHPVFLLLSGISGAGLMFSAATNTCGMAMMLARLPWNQQDTSYEAREPQEVR